MSESTEGVAVSESEAERVRKHLRVYVMVFVALAVLTIVTVAISYIQLPTALAISVAMVVATVKASLVAGYFMHLLSEEKVIISPIAGLPPGQTRGSAPSGPAPFYHKHLLQPEARSPGAGPPHRPEVRS